jgi:hypothetical protein
LGTRDRPSPRTRHHLPHAATRRGRRRGAANVRPTRHDRTDFDLAFAVRQLEDAGFKIVRTQEQDATVRFFDVGALVYYLRAIPWIVPDFDVDADRDTLHRIHDTIRADGSFGVGSYRFLIEARTMP